MDYISLENLAKVVLGFGMDKYFQIADWRIRPIPKGMVDYARCDSHYLIPIFLYLLKCINPNLQPDSKLYISPDLIEFTNNSANNWVSNLSEIEIWLKQNQNEGENNLKDIYRKLLSKLATATIDYSIQKMFSKSHHKTLEIKVKKSVNLNQKKKMKKKKKKVLTKEEIDAKEKETRRKKNN